MAMQVNNRLYNDLTGFAPPPEIIQRQHDAAAGVGQPGVDPSQAQSDELFNQIMQLTKGRAGELRNDPVQQQVMKYLQGTLSGKNVPYSNTVLNSLNAQHGRGTAGAEAAQMQSLRDSLGATGGSIYDPSYQAASREAMSQRQGANLDYAGQLGAQAGVANFNAQQQGAGMLGSLRNAQNAQINGLQGQAAGYTAGRFYETPGSQPSTPTTLMPQYGGGGQMGAAGQTGTAGQAPKPAAPTGAAPAPQPQAQPMAQTQQAPRPQAQQSADRPFQFNRQLPMEDPDMMKNLFAGLMNKGGY